MFKHTERYFIWFFSASVAVVALYLMSACAARPPAPFQLANTRWTLTSMTWNGAPLPLAAQVPTLEFQADKLSGNAGCNSYGGNYKTLGEIIQVEQLQMTLMACADANIMAQESAYLQALSSAKLYEAREDTLKITYGDGNGLLTFQRALEQ
ncbi:MAG: META domain-containing protein [Chloroflexi bacterium]|nr:META domain-containing protein [Chloroflexota bacterium]